MNTTLPTTHGVESGSLLEQALKREDALENTLVVNVFVVVPSAFRTSRPEQLQLQLQLTLAETAVALNQYIQSQKYPWISGGDGPVFGIHVTDGMAHLQCRYPYGVSVADEWFLIGLVLQFTADTTSDIVASCWDCDDGQVILIQAAEELPDWVEQIGPDACRHLCWIRNGGVCLIAPAAATSPSATTTTPLSLVDALMSLATSQSLSLLQPRITAIIQETVRRVQTAPHSHTTAVALPRSVATLFYHRPDFVAVAANAFQYHAERKSALPNNATAVLAGTCRHDWIVTTLAMGRTHYAMLRTLEVAPHWTATTTAARVGSTSSSSSSSSTVPAVYRSVEVKRLERTTRAADHLQVAVLLGVRLVAGLEYLLMNATTEAPQPSLSLLERRVLQYWTRIDKESGGNGEWLRQAWEAGPNHSSYSLEHICKCPAYAEEIACDAPPFHQQLTPLSHPEMSLAAQIKSGLHRIDQVRTDDSLPGLANVDSDDWMALPSDEELKRMTEPVTSSADLDNMLQGLESFMNDKSTVDGVATRQPALPSTRIDPDIALQILHMTLTAKSVEEMQWPASNDAISGEDQYFTKEDYDMELDDDDGDNESNDSAEDDEMQSKRLGTNESNASVAAAGSDDMAQNIHVLTNLIKSLEAEGGATGPVQNMLRELGMQPPRMASSD